MKEELLIILRDELEKQKMNSIIKMLKELENYKKMLRLKNINN